MAIQHYKGKLGEFDYDNNEFKTDEYGDLRYIGSETDGSKIHIPEGIISCVNMFLNYLFLKTAPVIPKSVIYCGSMFHGCKCLEEAPVIPDGVRECDYMFYECSALKSLPKIPGSVLESNGIFDKCDCKVEV